MSISDIEKRAVADTREAPAGTPLEMTKALEAAGALIKVVMESRSDILVDGEPIQYAVARELGIDGYDMISAEEEVNGRFRAADEPLKTSIQALGVQAAKTRELRHQEPTIPEMPFEQLH